MPLILATRACDKHPEIYSLESCGKLAERRVTLAIAEAVEQN